MILKLIKTQKMFRIYLLLFFLVSQLQAQTTMIIPPKLQMLYGGLVGLLFAPEIHIAGIFSTPELALVVGNIFSRCRYNSNSISFL